MPELSAAVGLAQIEKLDFLIKKRRHVAMLYEKALAPLARYLALPKTAPRMTHTWFVYVVRLLDPRMRREKIMSELSKRGIETRPYLPSIHLFDVYRKLGHKEGELPVSEAVSARTIALPFYSELTKKDVGHIARMLRAIITKK